MKALTISQPYASLIASGEKWVENRGWHLHYRGWIAIHAGKGTQYLTTHELRRYPTGCVLAKAEAIACIFVGDGDPRRSQPREVRIMEAAGISLDVMLAHKHTEGPCCIVLRDVRRYREPIPCAGKQGLWDWEEPDLVEIVGAQ